MTKYLAGVMSVIAAGVLLIAYGLLAPRASASFGSGGVEAPQQAVALQAPMYPNTAVSPYPGSQYVAAVPVQYQAVAQYPAQAVAYQYVPASYAAAPASYATPVSMQVVQPAPAVRTVTAPRRTVVRTVDRAPKRDWKKTALVIGGSTAGGAGLGGIFGGKKGALIGAAIGGGASTLFEATRH